LAVNEYEALYFGAAGSVGHYLWAPTGEKLYGWLPSSYGLPWDHIDGPLLPRTSAQQGHGLMHREQDWTALSIHDYTVDHRPGSHATFFLNRDVISFAEAVGALCAWPFLASVFDRIGPWTEVES